MRIGIVGLGLIGGSIALAARERLGAEVAGFDPDPGALAAAADRGAVERADTSLAAAVADAEVAFVAAPAGALPGVAQEVLAAAPAGCVVSDVGSTKRGLVGVHADERFVGGHPLAGAESAGIEHARADLFDGATWYLTPTETTSGILYERLHRVVAGLGGRPVAVDAETHDAQMAAVSHLPHVFANVLVAGAVAALGGERPPQIGPSFRDATRVAGANPAIWTDIYLANRDALTAQIDGAIGRLERFRDALGAADRAAVDAAAAQAAVDRARLSAADRPGEDLRELRIAVPNRPGVVAELALALGRGGVNIADLALYPAADMRDGVVAIWVAGEATADRASTIVAGLGHGVYAP